MRRTHHRTCTICEAMCGVTLEIDDGRIVDVRGDRDDPFSLGHVCPKALALKDVYEDPNRKRTPLRRTAKGWEAIPWDDALDLATDRLSRIQREHGKDAVALYQGNPTVHNHGSLLYGQVLARALGTRNLYSATSCDQLPHMLAGLEMFGHQLAMPVPDVDRTDFFLMLGANPVASNGSLMTAPGIVRRLTALVSRGGQLVVIDPRRTETAKLATTHHAIRPGGDAALLLALLHVIFDERLARPGRLASMTDGLDRLAELTRAFPPLRIADAIGIEADTIAALARSFARAERAVAYGRVGLSTQEHGAVGAWLVHALNVVTGNLDRPGGSMFTTPAADVVPLLARLGERGHFDRARSRVRKLPEFGGEFPAATLADEIETAGPGQVRALVTSAGNPVLSTPNGERLARALASLEFMVSVDFYINETTRHAHLLLPPTWTLEHDHYDLAFHLLAVRNTAKWSAPLFDPPAGSRHDWQILLDLASGILSRRGRAGRLLGAGLRAGLGSLGPRGLVELLLRTGPHRLSVKQLLASPHGVDLGPLTSVLPERLYTPNRRIHLAPPRLAAGLTSVERWLSRPRSPGLLLIGRRDLRSNNSWLHNTERLVKGPSRCTVLMHPDDAHARGLASGDVVRVRSRAGEISLPVELTDGILRGVVSIPHGWGHDRDGVQLDVARLHAGASINDLVDEAVVDGVSGTAVQNGVPVEIVRGAT